MIIALASPRFAGSVDACLAKIERMIAEAAERKAAIVCFPEAYLPGYRGLDFDVPPFDAAQQEQAMKKVSTWARDHRIAVVLGMEWHATAGRHLAAAVFDGRGELLGVQTKNQLDPSEDPLYVPGRTRQLFEIDGLKFGVVICHEGFRYPETVRWAAVAGEDRVSSAIYRQRSGGPDVDDVGRRRCTVLRAGDDDAEPGEHDLLRERQLRDALSRIGDEFDCAVRRMLWPISLTAKKGC